MGKDQTMKYVLALLLLACIGLANAAPAIKGAGDTWNEASDTEQQGWANPLTTAPPARPKSEGKCCDKCTGDKQMYFSIADNSGPWLCGQTCIRSSFYPIFHIFEGNLTKSATNGGVCADAGYTKYVETTTHGGGGLYCTLGLYACAAGSGNCPHPA